MASFSENLDTVKNWLKDNFEASYKAFRPGLKREKIDKLLKNFDFPGTLPEEVYTLYTWHDGLQHNAEFFPGYSFYPLKEALEEYELCQEISQRIQAESEEDIEVWKAGWLPIFGFQGDYYMLNCTGEGDPLVYFCPAEDEPYAWFDSLETMLETLVKCYDIGAFYVDDDLMEADSEASETIRAHLNRKAVVFDRSAEQPQIERRELQENEDGSKILTTYYTHDNIVEEHYGTDNRKTGQVQTVQGELIRRDTWNYIGENQVEIITENFMGMMTTTKTLADIDEEGRVQSRKIETYLNDLLIMEQDLTEDEDEDAIEEEADEEPSDAQ